MITLGGCTAMLVQPHAYAFKEGKSNPGWVSGQKKKPLPLGPGRSAWLLGTPHSATTIPAPTSHLNSWGHSVLGLVPALTPNALTLEHGVT